MHVDDDGDCLGNESSFATAAFGRSLPPLPLSPAPVAGCMVRVELINLRRCH